MDPRFYQALVSGNLAQAKHLIQDEGVDPLHRILDTTALHIAVTHNHKHLVRFLLAHPIIGQMLLDARDDDGMTALHWAAQKGDTEVVSLLLAYPTIDHEAKTKIKKKQGQETPLHLAARQGNTEVVALLLRKGSNCNARNFNHRTPLHAATSQGHLEVAALLLKQDSIVLEAKNKHNATLLRLAARQGNTEVVGLLLNKGINCNAQCLNHWTPLHEAAAQGHVGVVALLLEQDGIDLEAQNENNETPLHLAARQESTQVLVLDATNKDSASALDLPFAQRHAQIVALLLKKGANYKACNLYKWTPLHIAASCGQVHVVSLLLEQDGIELEAITTQHETALHLAASNRHPKVVALLLNKRSNCNARNAEGWTPLHLAIYQNVTEFRRSCGEQANNVVNAARGPDAIPFHLTNPQREEQVIALLLERSDIMVDATDPKECTPLHLAAVQGNAAVVRLLLNKGSNFNKVYFGANALHLAAYHGHVGVVALLLAQDGIDLEVTTAQHETALHLAASNRHPKVVELLLNKGSNCNACNAQGWTPLHLAIYRNVTEFRRSYEEQANNVVNAARGPDAIPFHLTKPDREQQVIALLLERPDIMVDAINFMMQTPLHLAAVQGNAAIVGLLLNKGSNFNKVYFGTTALHLAAYLGHVGVVACLLKQPTIVVDPTDEDQSTPLHFAAARGHQAITLLLLEKRSNCNATNSTGITPLYLAVNKKYSASTPRNEQPRYHKILQILLRAGANPYVTEKSPWELIPADKHEAFTETVREQQKHRYFKAVEALVMQWQKGLLHQNTSCLFGGTPDLAIENMAYFIGGPEVLPPMRKHLPVFFRETTNKIAQSLRTVQIKRETASQTASKAVSEAISEAVSAVSAGPTQKCQSKHRKPFL